MLGTKDVRPGTEGGGLGGEGGRFGTGEGRSGGGEGRSVGIGGRRAALRVESQPPGWPLRGLFALAQTAGHCVAPLPESDGPSDSFCAATLVSGCLSQSMTATETPEALCRTT